MPFVHGLLCARWFFLAIAATSACPSGCELMTFPVCGIVVVCSGADLACLALASCCIACSAFSSKQIFLIFSWFLLYSPTVLHTTICIRRGIGSSSRGIVSVTMARSFSLITVFFRLSVSSVIVCGGVVCNRTVWNYIPLRSHGSPGFGCFSCYCFACKVFLIIYYGGYFITKCYFKPIRYDLTRNARVAKQRRVL